MNKEQKIEALTQFMLDEVRSNADLTRPEFAKSFATITVETIEGSIKTLSQWDVVNESQGLSEFLFVGDEIDEGLYFHLGCGWMAAKYNKNGIMQGGDAYDTVDGVYTYDTVCRVGDK